MTKSKKVAAKKVVKKTVVVDKKFLNDLADDIYSPSTKKFLYLCDGTLQNGPCPIDGKPMHCGLGELWLAMTGTQPKSKKGLGESDVIDKAVELSTIGSEFTAAEVEIRKLKLPKDAIEQLVDQLADCKADSDNESEFRTLLDEIPGANDDNADEEKETTLAQYKARARSVAAKFREAAKLLT